MNPTDNGPTPDEHYSRIPHNLPATPPPLSVSLLHAQAGADEPTIALIPSDARKADGMPTLGTPGIVRERFSLDMSDKVARQNTSARMMTIVLGGFVVIVLVIGLIFMFAITGHNSPAANHDNTAPVVFANLTATPAMLAGMTTVTAFPVPTQTTVITTPVPSTQTTYSSTPATPIPHPSPTAVPPTATPVPTTGWNAVVTKNGPAANGYRTAIILDEYYDPQQCGGWCNHWRGRDVIFIPSATANSGGLSMGVFGYASSAGAGAQPSSNGRWDLQNFAYPANQIDMFTGPEIFTPCANVSFVFTQGSTQLFNFSLDSISCKP